MSGNAKLTLIVDGTLSVYGGAAGNGTNGTVVNSPGGVGGFAGVYVPRGTTLEVRGSGTLKAYGGHGGDGGDGIVENLGGGAGGGAGAGIGGNGGDGGAGGNGTHNSTDIGKPGSAGVSAGTIYLYERVTVTAYGGAGGSGGWDANSCPGGGGGYPAAGIGGGGAGGGGGSHGPAGAGFSGGAGDGAPTQQRVLDGVGAPAATHGSGGGYFSSYNGTYKIDIQPALGGGAAKYLSTSEYGDSRGGNGGAAGDGGEVKKANTAVLTAANGSYKTATKQWGTNPTPIYAQSGYSLDKLREAGVRTVDAGLTANGVRSKAALEAELGTKGKTLIPTGLAGVGSGAGYTESSNGTYATAHGKLEKLVFSPCLFRGNVL